jgi:hypothetical protein
VKLQFDTCKMTPDSSNGARTWTKDRAEVEEQPCGVSPIGPKDPDETDCGVLPFPSVTGRQLAVSACSKNKCKSCIMIRNGVYFLQPYFAHWMRAEPGTARKMNRPDTGYQFKHSSALSCARPGGRMCAVNSNSVNLFLPA